MLTKLTATIGLFHHTLPLSTHRSSRRPTVPYPGPLLVLVLPALLPVLPCRPLEVLCEQLSLSYKKDTNTIFGIHIFLQHSNE